MADPFGIKTMVFDVLEYYKIGDRLYSYVLQLSFNAWLHFFCNPCNCNLYSILPLQTALE